MLHNLNGLNHIHLGIPYKAKLQYNSEYLLLIISLDILLMIINYSH